MTNSKPGKKKIFLILGGAALLACVLAAFFIWLAYWLKVYEIDVNDYVRVSFDGYDEVGSARIDFDRDAFLKDYSGKLRYKDRADRVLGDPAEALLDVLETIVRGENGLSDGEFSNGDAVEVRWKGKIFREKLANAKLSAESFEVTVDGLTAPGVFDAFGALEVVAEGLDGEGYLVKVVEHSGLKYKYDLDYTVASMGAPDGQLRNGDTVTVSIGGTEKARELIRKYHMKPAELEKTFTISELTTYTTFDPFADVRLVFGGKNGEGIIQDFVNDSPLPAAQKLGFVFEPNQGLRNGDTVTARVVEFSAAKKLEMAKAYGMIPDPLEGTFVVSGLPEEEKPGPGGEADPGEQGDPGGEDPEESGDVFGTLTGRHYENTYFGLKAEIPAEVSVYGKDHIPSGIIGGLNDLYAEAGRTETLGVRIQRLTDEEKAKTSREILLDYSEEIFAIYEENGLTTSHELTETEFAGERWACLDITAEMKVIVVVLRVRHRIYIRTEGGHAIAVSVMAGNDEDLARYCALFEKLK